MRVTRDSELLEGLRSDEAPAYRLLYDFYFPMVWSLVRRNSGSREDAEDVFQESLLILHDNARRPGFVLSASLKTYLYAIARNQWLKRLRADKPSLPLDEEAVLCEPRIEIDPAENRIASARGWLALATAHCQRILTAIFFSNESMERLMAKMGWKNRHTADNQKYKCLQQVKKISRQG